MATPRSRSRSQLPSVLNDQELRRAVYPGSVHTARVTHGPAASFWSRLPNAHGFSAGGLDVSIRSGHMVENTSGPRAPAISRTRVAEPPAWRTPGCDGQRASWYLARRAPCRPLGPAPCWGARPSGGRAGPRAACRVPRPVPAAPAAPLGAPRCDAPIGPAVRETCPTAVCTALSPAAVSSRALCHGRRPHPGAPHTGAATSKRAGPGTWAGTSAGTSRRRRLHGSGRWLPRAMCHLARPPAPCAAPAAHVLAGRRSPLWWHRPVSRD